MLEGKLAEGREELSTAAASQLLAALLKPDPGLLSLCLQETLAGLELHQR